MKSYGLDEIQDLVLVGAGPASLATLYEAQRRGLKAIAIDKGPLCSALLQHPTHMRWFSTTDKLELGGFPLLTNEKNPTRREYLQYCRAFARYFDLKVVTYREVHAIIPLDGLFRVEARDLFGRTQVWRSRNVALATGFYDSPRPLDVPGEDLPKVSHRFTEVHYYADHDVMVIGAGSSAAEVALELYRAGTNVSVAMRGDRFYTKYWIEPDIENRIKEGSIACYRNVNVKEIRPDDVVLEDAHGADITVPNDFVLAMTGYEPDTALLELTGANVDRVTKKPWLSQSLETTVPGLYVAGTLCAGCESNLIFVENSREHGLQIIENILRTMPAVSLA
ncbi:MAG: YpdA family putative bacillithiol disulfide reductase [Candidatus Hydrogenedentes bacterium]|nr:YpdA family putative bacillithiol disulfide reductase [Candidatus Hydrogenedentota bacterium]